MKKILIGYIILLCTVLAAISNNTVVVVVDRRRVAASQPATTVPIPAQANLVFYHDFQATNTTQVIDASGNGHNASNKPSVVAGPVEFIAGTNQNDVVNLARRFDGSSDAFHIKDAAALNLNTGLTFSGWVWRDQTARDEAIMSKLGSSGSLQTEYSLRMDNSPATIRAQAWGALDASITRGRTAPEFGTNGWTHLVWWWNGGTAATDHQVFVDGVQVDNASIETGSFTGIVDGTSSLVIGTWFTDGTFPFDGAMDNIAVWNRVLTTNEIQTVCDNNHPTNDIMVVP